MSTYTTSPPRVILSSFPHDPVPVSVNALLRVNGQPLTAHACFPIVPSSSGNAVVINTEKLSATLTLYIHKHGYDDNDPDAAYPTLEGAIAGTTSIGCVEPFTVTTDPEEIQIQFTWTDLQIRWPGRYRFKLNVEEYSEEDLSHGRYYADVAEAWSPWFTVV
ncbi:hypothetical protein VTJ49DRAFT_2532 [Mycothermus thermophilus]|uniref:Uncharacterized protein n=1 Tax=Humicola insolens TaxID=85995 RepID=A0ABR3V9Y8_HUMIN